MGTIYGLCDPNGDLRYIGLTTLTAQDRYQQHLRDHTTTTFRGIWIQTLREKEMRPFLKVLEENVPNEKLYIREGEWIRKMRAAGCNLTNMVDLQGCQSKEALAKRSTALKNKPWSSKRRRAYKPYNRDNGHLDVWRRQKPSETTRALLKTAKAIDRGTLRFCPLCSKSFSGKLGLSIHATRTHKFTLGKLLDLAFKVSPEQVKPIFAEIEENDREIARLLKEIGES